MIDIKEMFLKLTSHTYPHGHESALLSLLPDELETDEFGNLYKQVGDNPSVMFTCHLDTATSANVEVNHTFEGNLIKSDGKSILGADDKAGVTILLYMIEKGVPGLYYFFLGEEVGCIGSKKVSAIHKVTKMENINKVVAFDRRGTGSIITHQCSSRCCSDDFATALSKELNKHGLDVLDNDTVLNYSPDTTGLYTDSAQFMSIYPECTNISVGYNFEHTFNEQQNIKHLDKLAKTVVLVDWESLPVKRDPSVVEYNYGRSYSNYGGWSDDEWEGYGYNNYSYNRNSYTPPVADENVWIYDEDYGNYVTCITINKWTKKVLNIDISALRLSKEEGLIAELLMVLDVEYKTLTWDGFTLNIDSWNGVKTSADRNELAEFIPDLNFWIEIDNREKEREKGLINNFHLDDDYPLNYD